VLQLALPKAIAYQAIEARLRARHNAVVRSEVGATAQLLAGLAAGLLFLGQHLAQALAPRWAQAPQKAVDAALATAKYQQRQ